LTDPPAAPVFFERFREVLRLNPDQLAFQSITRTGRESITYAQVGREIRAISCYLREQGVRPESKVGLLIENHPRWGIAFLAAQSAGAVLVPLDVLHPPETLAGLIRHSECVFLFASGKLLPVLTQVQDLLPEPLPALVTGDSGGAFPEWDAALDRHGSVDAPIPLVERSLEDPHVILYTSGTTGDPKGVVLTGRNLYRNVVEALKGIEVTSRDHFLGVLPLYHILSLIVNFIVPLYSGAKSTFLDVLDAQRIMKAFREEGITIFVCVPQFYYLLHRRILSEVEKQGRLKRFLFRRMLALSRFCHRRLGVNPGRRLFPAVHRPFGPQFRFFGVGGARFDPEVVQFLTDLGFVVVQAYGMTETAALATITPPRPVGVGSVGTPMPHVQIRIDRPDDRGVGEILIRGENVMREYFKNPRATHETIDREGWLHTGDLGYQAAGGFVYITGRAKEVIVLSSGKNIYPEEVEHFYQSNCPLIQEMCVVGREDPSGEQERLHAVVVPDFDELKRQGIVHTQNRIRYLMETLSQRLPPYKRVRSIDVWREPLPRTTTRKIKRFEVEKSLKEGVGAAEPVQDLEWRPVDDVEVRLVELVRQVKPGAKPHPQASLELDLGLDSLERVELISTLQEAFRVSPTEEEAASLYTFQDVADFVKERLDAPSEGEGGRLSWAEILDEPLTPEEDAEVRRLRRRPLVEWLAVLTAGALRLTAKALFRLRGEGIENFPGRYPFLICPNHLSFLDAFLVVCLLPPRIVRRFFSLGYTQYFGGGWGAFLGGLVKTIPVSADHNLRQTLRLAAEGLRRELVLLVFPEGERSIDGTLRPFRKGPAILARKIGVPVVPVGIRGSYEAWPRGSSKVRLRPIRIRFGEPIAPGPEETVEHFNDRLREAVRQLL
jgi:long-chain acyl-CoA synthetase